MDAFALKASLGLDSSAYEKGLDHAKSMAGSIFNGIKTIAKAGTMAIGAAGTAVAGLGAASVKSYAEYEQLVGGVQKLYGNMGMNLEDYAKSVGKTTDEVRTDWQNLDKAQNLVLANAKNAYKTAGMSANQYMNTATSFSASLIKSLGGDTVKAAEQTDVAMKAISDNFNTFGGDIGMIQGAFMGFAKQNYTMLDNLKLGYGGTKTEMLNLINDANEYAKSIGQASDLSIDSFSDIVTAIDLIQQKQQIAGTTTREAMTTIEGSANATKAAWENVITAIASGEGLSDAIQGLTSSIFGEKEGEGLLNQVIPRITQAMDGIGEFIGKAAPYITEKLPELIDAVVPNVVNGGIQLLGALGQALVENAPELIGYVLELMDKVAVGISEFDWAKTAEDIANFLNNAISGDGLTHFMDAATSILSGLATGIGEALPVIIPEAIDGILTFIDNFLSGDGIDKLIDGGLALITGLATGLINSIPTLLEKVPVILEKLVGKIIETAPKLAKAASHIITSLGDALVEVTAPLLEKGAEIIATIKEGISQKIEDIKAAGSELIENIKAGIEEKIDIVKQAISDMWTAVLNNPIVASIVEYVSTSFENMKNTLSGIWDGIKGYAENAWKLVKNAVLTPVLLLIDLVTGNFDKLKDDMSNIWNNIKEAAVGMWNALKDTVVSLVVGLWNQVKLNFTTMKDGVVNFVTETKDKAISLWTTLKDKVIETAGNLISSVQTKIKELPGIIEEKFTEAVDFIKELPSKAMEWGKDLIGNFIDGIKQKWDDLKNNLSVTADTIRSFLGFSEPEVGPLSNFHTYAPDMMKLFAEGIRDNTHLVTDQINKSFDFSDSITGSVPVAGSSTGAAQGGSIVVNVYGAEGQSEERLAEIVGDRLMHELNMRQLSYA